MHNIDIALEKGGSERGTWTHMTEIDRVTHNVTYLHKCLWRNAGEWQIRVRGEWLVPSAKIKTITGSDALHREGGLCQEVGITEHVFLVHGKPKEGTAWVLYIEHQWRVPGQPHRI